MLLTAKSFEFLVSRSGPEIARRFQGLKAAGSVESMMYQAVIAQYSGKVTAAVSILERALKLCSKDEFPQVLELLVPILIMTGRILDAERILDSAPPAVGTFASGRSAMYAALYASDGNEAMSLSASARARKSLHSATQVLGARTLQRLAFASFWQGDVEGALDDAISSARLFESIGAYRSAAASYSIAYNVHHTLTGNVETAYEFASRMTLFARRSEDKSFEAAGTVAQYELAAEMYDRESHERLGRALTLRPLPRQYKERLARGIADCLPYGWQGDFMTFRANIAILRDGVAEGRAELSLCTALRSLADAAIGERASASQGARNAIALSGLTRPNEAAYESRYRRLARGIACCTCMLLGDIVRARRTMQIKRLDGHEDLRALLKVVEGMPFTEAPRSIRGYAVLVAKAREILRTTSESPFTPGESVILRMLAEGQTAPEIARMLGRSVHTVRAHTRSIICKMDAKGRGAAIQAARRQGLLA